MLTEGTLPIGKIWEMENRVSSDDNTIDVSLKNLIPDESGNIRELNGKFVRVDGGTKLNGMFNYDPFRKEGSKVTTDGFDQVQLYYAINSVQKYWSDLGIKFSHPIVAHANAMSDVNAYYDNTKDELVFGTSGEVATGDDKWHLASDHDVSIHEAGHRTFDHINPKLGNWWSGEGRAIHEGFGDGVATLYNDDPELSEDFAAYFGKPESKTDGLRTVNHNLKLSDVGSEEHDRGQVYGGFLWSVKGRIEDLDLTSKEATDITHQILVAHARKYKTDKPAPADFVDAFIAGAKSVADKKDINIEFDTLKKIIEEEADKRELRTNKVSLPPELEDEFASVKQVKERFGQSGLIRFVAGESNTEQQFYSQQYKTRKEGYVDIIGGGIIEGKQDGTVSVRDIRQIKPGEIDETVKVDVIAAMVAAYTDAMGNLNTARDKLELLSARKTLMSDKKYRAQLSTAQMNYKIASIAVENLKQKLDQKKFAPPEHMGKDSIPEARLVILPYSNNLTWEVKAGWGTYYVDAQMAGKIQFKQDVFVN